MNSYFIPLVNESSFLSKVKKYVNKSNGAVKVYPTSNVELIEKTIYINNLPKDVKVECREYKVEGSYRLNGWAFVGTIEHKDGGNIIRCIDDKYSDETMRIFKDAPCKCDHCNTIRNRKDTYIVYNEETHEFKQVGKSCLKEYTGFDAEQCANIAQFISTMIGFEEPISMGLNHAYLDGLKLRELAYDYIKIYGYTKDASRNDVVDAYFGTGDKGSFKSSATKQEIDDVTTWIKALSEENPYNAYYNACDIIWNSESVEFRDINYILSMLSNYFKDVANGVRKEIATVDKGANEYVGKEGDRITFVVKKVRIIMELGKYSYYSDYSYLIELIDEKGHTYLWSTSKDVEEGDTVKATVKGYSEYKGVKQTIITRGTVIEQTKEPKKEEDEPSDYKKSAQYGFDMFAKYVDGEIDETSFN